MILAADARSLPFRDGAFDCIFGSPPWDDLDVVMAARPELRRVLSRRGQMILVLPHLDDPRLATLAVTNRDWTERSSYAVEKPVEDKGWRYRSMSDGLAERVLRRSGAHRVLDPFTGTGTIPRVARRLGMFAVGCDLSLVATGLAAAVG